MLAITVDISDDVAANFDTPEAIRRALFEDFVTDVLRLAEQHGIIASVAEIVEGLQGARIYLPFGAGQRRDPH